MNESNALPSGRIAAPVLLSLGGSIGALVYAPIAGELHVYANEWVDFPVLAQPWFALVVVGLMAGLRARHARSVNRLNQVLTWTSLGIAGLQIVGAAILLVSAVASSSWLLP